MSLPLKIQALISKRNESRKQKRFEEADKIRRELEQLGYQVADEPDGKTKINEKFQLNSLKPKKSFLVLFGSGEISPTGRRIHEYVLQQIKKDPVNIALITTPAGFQPNVRVVYDEVAQFFKTSLKNFHPNITFVDAYTSKDANNPEIVNQLNGADYIFTGPGSPTYALKQLRGSLLLQKIVVRLNEGASLSLASAATISFSNFALPVYEIYKVGTKLYWEQGINFYESFFKKITVIPHLNNDEGGEKTDTSYCYMGKDRFKKLLHLLPTNEEVWGIDEHTALIVDLQSKQYRSMGKGNSHMISPSSF